MNGRAAFAAIGLWLTFLPSLVLADGPALAHLTLEGRTITLTADSQVNNPQAEGGSLYLHFAQRHLGFPLPPMLTVDLRNTDGTWVLSALTLDRTEPETPLIFPLQSFEITGIQGESPNLSLTIEGDAMALNRGPIPVHLEITLRSP